MLPFAAVILKGPLARNWLPLATSTAMEEGRRLLTFLWSGELDILAGFSRIA